MNKTENICKNLPALIRIFKNPAARGGGSSRCHPCWLGVRTRTCRQSLSLLSSPAVQQPYQERQEQQTQQNLLVPFPRCRWLSREGVIICWWSRDEGLTNQGRTCSDPEGQIRNRTGHHFFIRVYLNGGFTNWNGAWRWSKSINCKRLKLLESCWCQV